MFVESKVSSYPDSEGLFRGSVRQQKESRRSPPCRPGVGNRAGRQLSGGGHLRAAAPPPPALSGEDHGSGVRGAGGALQRPSEEAWIAIAPGQPCSFRRVHRVHPVLLREVLPQEVPAGLREVHAGNGRCAEQPNWGRHGWDLPCRGFVLGLLNIIGSFSTTRLDCLISIG